VIVLRDGAALGEKRLLEHCAAHLARFKLPGRVIFREQLPRNASGKVQKRLLRDEILGSAEFG
jgi:acyl-CoA synthetase (AMP-forming)/AMP-acid ligase II